MAATVSKKYVIINLSQPVIFSSAIPHKAMQGVCGDTDRITSAGFIHIRANENEIDIRTEGGSEGLGIGSRPDDAQIIKMSMKL